MKADTKYITYWLKELNADAVERRAVNFYTLLFCIDFMGEQGMRFSNDTTVSYNQSTIDILHLLYQKLISNLR